MILSQLTAPRVDMWLHSDSIIMILSQLTAPQVDMWLHSDTLS